MSNNSYLGRGVLFVVLLLILVPGTAAAETRVGPTVTVPAGTVLDDDLTTAAGTVRIDGTVDGDVTALGGEVVLDGAVTGDVTAFAGRVTITGDVMGDVRTFGGATQVDGDVAGDLSSIGGSTTVGGRVGGDVEVRGVIVEILEDGTIGGQVQTSAVRTQVNGSVGDSSGTTANATVFQAPADSDGTRWDGPAFVMVLPVHAAMLPDAGVTGSSAVPLQLVRNGSGVFDLTLFDVYGFAVNLLLGVLLVWVFPRFSQNVASQVVTRPGRTAVHGVAVLLVGPAILLILGLSLLGLPLALAGVLLLSIVAWVGSALGRFAVGTWVLSLTPRLFEAAGQEPPDLENRWLGLVVGYVVVGLLIRVPVVGAAFDTVVLVLGVGALGFLGVEAYRRSERTPGPVTVPETADD